jgi:SH3 domain protein
MRASEAVHESSANRGLPLCRCFESIGDMRQLKAFACLGAATVLFALSAAPAWTQEPVQDASPAGTVRLFVSDKLVLNVYSEPDQGGERVATIETGDAVEELERADNFVRVRLENGGEGWVGANYLTADAPAAVRLRELQREQKAAAPAVDKKSLEEIARLRKQNATLEGELTTLKASVAASPPPQGQPLGETQSYDELESEPESAAQPDEEEQSGGVGRIVVSAGLAALVAALSGFAAGYHTLARRLRRKFGGLKIY